MGVGGPPEPVKHRSLGPPQSPMQWVWGGRWGRELTGSLVTGCGWWCGDPTLRTAALEHNGVEGGRSTPGLTGRRAAVYRVPRITTWVTQSSQLTDGRALRLRKEKPLAGHTQLVGDGAGAPSWGPGPQRDPPTALSLR